MSILFLIPHIVHKLVPISTTVPKNSSQFIRLEKNVSVIHSVGVNTANIRK